MAKAERIPPEIRPVRADVLRRIVADAMDRALAHGCAVEIAPDGTVRLLPGEPVQSSDPTLIDWSRP